MTNWTNTFSGSAVKPSIVSYQSITMAANTALAWPTETIEGVPYVAAAIDVTASSGGLVLSMPSAVNGSTGVASMITNVGANSFTVQDASGNAIAVLTASQSWVIVLKDNTTTAGQWRAIQLAATTSNANAAALAGAGLQANGATLQTNDVTVSLAVNTLIDSTYRAKVIVWTGAAGTLTLDTLAHVGAGWNCWIVNEGTGVLTIATSGADTINTGVATLQIPVGATGASLAFRVSASGTNFNIFGGVANPLPPGSGGTGVVNDPTNTLTFTGHFSLNLTLQNNTAITLPTSGTLAILGVNTFTGKQTAPQLATSGNLGAPSWTTSGLRLSLAAATLTDSSSAGVVAAVYGDAHKAVTFAAGAATTYTNAYGAYFEDPVQGGGATLTNKWAIGADSAKINGAATITGVLTIGSKTLAMSNSLTLAGTDGTTMTFPTTNATIARTDAANTFTGTQTFVGDLLFTDATYDIGKSGATRPRDGFFSRNLRVVGQLATGTPTTSALLELRGSGGAGQVLYSATASQTTSTGENAANACLKVLLDSGTSRSINAGGTINASGADYAEYETKAPGCGDIAKGQIVGFDANGLITDKFANAVTFGIKSTTPSYVGGDSFGAEDAICVADGRRLGQRPWPPQAENFASEDEFADACAQYEQAIAEFEPRLEANRQTVDRIAYSGKVPVNVIGASVGDYIVAVQSGVGIDGKPVSTPAPDEYRMAVGRVRRILPDGRCVVAVMVH